jgi:ABC-type sugar transport system substrate-binding protein
VYREMSKWRLWPMSIVCMLVAALLVVGCGSSDEPSQSTSAGSTATADGGKLESILVVNPLPDNPQWRTFGDLIKKEGEALGIEMSETGPTKAADPTQMIEAIQTGIASKVGGILTYPASPAFQPVLEQAEKAGIVTGTLYGGGANGTGQFNIGADLRKIGAVYVQALADRPGPQVVGIITADATGGSRDWVEGFKEAAKQTDNVTVVGTVYTGDDPARALSQANALLAAHPDITVVASNLGTATTPTVSAIKAKGLKGKVVMLANGGVAGGVEGAKEGIVYRFLQQNAPAAAKAAVKAAADIAAGKTVPAQIDVEGVMIDPKDYERYKAEGWI